MIVVIFLLISFLMGLLGVNVGGILGIELFIVFGLFCVGFGLIFGLEFWILCCLCFFDN